MYGAQKVEVQVYQGNEGKGRKTVDMDIWKQANQKVTVMQGAFQGQHLCC